jgi:hypothetical protein
VLRNKRSASLSNHTALISRDGTEWPIADSAAPIVDREGTIVGVVLVFREISEERPHRGGNRKAAAERERLLQSERAARSEAEKANRVKDDFVAMVSHELRTPLNAILGWTELLKRTPGDAVNVERGLDVIARNTRLQAQLIMDLLDVSRIVSGKIHLELDRVDLGPIVQASIEALEPTADEKGVTLTAQVDPDPTPILGDPVTLAAGRLEPGVERGQVHAPGGTVAIAMRRAGDNALVTVTDSGWAFDPRSCPRSSSGFRQGAGMTTRRHGGLGSGCRSPSTWWSCMAARFAHPAQGEDRGATFTVELPVIRSEPFAAEVRSRIRPQRPAPPTCRSMACALWWCEDELDTRDLIRRLLEAHRAEVIVAASALEALELLESARPDLVVSDIGLPDVDGYEFIQRMRNLDGSLGRLPAVALTAFASSRIEPAR